MALTSLFTDQASYSAASVQPSPRAGSSPVIIHSAASTPKSGQDNKTSKVQVELFESSPEKRPHVDFEPGDTVDDTMDIPDEVDTDYDPEKEMLVIRNLGSSGYKLSNDETFSLFSTQSSGLSR